MKQDRFGQKLRGLSCCTSSFWHQFLHKKYLCQPRYFGMYFLFNIVFLALLYYELFSLSFPIFFGLFFTNGQTNSVFMRLTSECENHALLLLAREKGITIKTSSIAFFFACARSSSSHDYYDYWVISLLCKINHKKHGRLFHTCNILKQCLLSFKEAFCNSHTA